MTSPTDDDRQTEDLPDLESMMELIDQSGYRDLVANPDVRRRRLFEELASSEDPMWREIGKQLRDGQIGLRDVLNVGAYWEKMQQGLAENQEKFRQAIVDAKQQLEQEAERHRRN